MGSAGRVEIPVWPCSRRGRSRLDCHRRRCAEPAAGRSSGRPHLPPLARSGAVGGRFLEVGIEQQQGPASGRLSRCSMTPSPLTADPRPRPCPGCAYGRRRLHRRRPHAPTYGRCCRRRRRSRSQPRKISCCGYGGGNSLLLVLGGMTHATRDRSELTPPRLVGQRGVPGAFSVISPSCQ